MSKAVLMFAVGSSPPEDSALLVLSRVAEASDDFLWKSSLADAVKNASFALMDANMLKSDECDSALAAK
jgi:hypothetical protein